MAVRCIECGYDNSLQYRYCGMCGAPLPLDPPARNPLIKNAPARMPSVTAKPAPPRQAPVATPEAPRPVPQQQPVARKEVLSVSGPSFLGLGLDQRTESDHTYLLEDEEPRRGAGRFVFVLLVLALAGGFAYLHFRSHGFPWATSLTPSTGPQVASGVSNEPSPSTPMPQANPQPQTTQGPPPSLLTPGEANTTAPQEAQKAAPDGQDAATQDSTPAAETTATPVTKPPTPRRPTRKSEPTETAPPAKSLRTAGTRKSASLDVPSKPTLSDAEAANDALVAQGEKYLYGTGVAQNCNLAQKSLMTAASRSSSHAQSLLGTMYATGHCATKDLPSAYRWFAKALHQDPHNTRISADLEVLWKQMSPAERQAAIGGR